MDLTFSRTGDITLDSVWIQRDLFTRILGLLEESFVTLRDYFQSVVFPSTEPLFGRCIDVSTDFAGDNNDAHIYS
jgi:hypothetical protein